MKFMDQVEKAAKAHAAKMGFKPIEWARVMPLFVAGAVWASKQMTLQLLRDIRKRDKK